jgi:Fe-S-cluster-containing hydrogenase component 2/CRP-like cAMP-binding protein
MAERIVLQTISEGESLTARGADDRLIAREAATRAMFENIITLKIDGITVKIPQALPATDFLGNIIREADGLPKPRTTTIYDAAWQIVRDGHWTEQDLNERIPVLCHKDHLNPVAVCRMCSVHVCRYSRGAGRFQPNDKLIPACQHEVQEGIEVTTWKGARPGHDSEKYAAQVTKSIRMLTELLVAENLHPDPVRDSRNVNELAVIANRLNVTEPRPAIRARVDRDLTLHPKSRPMNLPMAHPVDPDLPYSARSILVDHDRCILCDRCARSCSDVKPFKIIGHTGKGYTSRVSFDLDAIMNDSRCVQCGECMTACPTGALTLRRRVAPQVFEGAPAIDPDPAVALPAGAGFLTAEEMQSLSLDYQGKAFKPFATIPFAFLKWNEGAVRRRVVEPGEYLCRYGDYGSTAFLLESGSFELLKPEGTPKPPAKPGFFARLFGGTGERPRPPESAFLTTGSQALILGELAALSNQQRKASIRAASPGVVYEITRNLLDMAQRSPSARGVFNEVYTRNAIASCLRNQNSDKSLFRTLDPADRAKAIDYFSKPGQATLFRFEPGQKIIREGDLVEPGDPESDYFYIVRRGFVKVVSERFGAERILNWFTTENHFGEVAYLSDHPAVAKVLPPGYDPGRRTASVIALDPVEVIRIPGNLIRGLLAEYPAIRDRLAEQCVQLLSRGRTVETAAGTPSAEYLNQGLFQGQKMLVLDLVKCTRCDECTRACADGHGDGISRLLREGERFGDFLVATSCRSCHKPYCMDGCPVDAIHRKGTRLEVMIDKHCIGCGLCETNCPYGAIQLVPKVDGHAERGMTAKVEKRAVNCDLCHDLVPPGADTFCVAACPHDAAFRWDGETLLSAVREFA